MKKLSALLASILFGLIGLMAFSGCDLLFGKSIVGTYKFNAVIEMGIAGRDENWEPIFEEKNRREIGDLSHENSTETYTENTYVLDIKEDKTFLIVHPGYYWSFFHDFHKAMTGTWEKAKDKITLKMAQGSIVFYQDAKQKDVLCYDSERDYIGEYNILQLKKAANPVEKQELKGVAGTYKFVSLTSKYGAESITANVGEKDGNGEVITAEYLLLDLRADGTYFAVGHEGLGLIQGQAGTWERTENAYRLLYIFELPSIDFAVEGDLLKILFSEDGEDITITLSK